MMMRKVLIIFLFCSHALADDFESLESGALQTLRDLVRLDTSQPAGREILAARYLGDRLTREGIESRIFESEPGRASIVARIRGSGTKRPLLLVGHTDVVTVEPDNWTFDPFSAEVSDGKVFGRGSYDDKSVVAACFEVFLALKRNHVALDRDVIFLGVADEEAGGELGIAFMVEQHFNEIEAEFAINEGGGGSINPETGDYVMFQVGTAEKVPRRARLIATGRAGHGAVPTRDNPIGVLSRAVTRLVENPLPMSLNDTSRAFFERLARSRPAAEVEIYEAILRANPSIEVQEQLRDINPSYYSIIRTSISPTIFAGGYQRNVIPSQAEATLDIRALPDADPDVLFEALAKIIDDTGVKVERMPVTRPAHSPSRLDTEVFQAFEQVLSARHPKAVVLPTMFAGASDSAQLRAAGIQTYGFGPGLVQGDDNGIHGNDEYLRLEPFYEYVRLMWLVTNGVAATP